MVIGELLYEENGKQTGVRVLDSVTSEPIAEISGLGSLKFEGIAINVVWTMCVRLADDGISYVEGNGIMYGENNEVAYVIEGLTRPNNSGGSSYRGSSRMVTIRETLATSNSKTNDKKLTLLNNKM
jgi:hypothetical protein